RVLLPYLQEAVLIFEEGGDIKSIDKTLFDFGMPMGAFTLIDTVGVDIGSSVATILNNAYGERMSVSTLMQEMLTKKWLGKKVQLGFYDYKPAIPIVNQDIAILQKGSDKISQEKIITRTMMIMINEASRCLEEDIVDNARYLDMAMVMGTGFPAFRGGLLRYADTLGAKVILDSLNELQDIHGKRFVPSQLLEEMAKNNDTFYGGVL
ncbi:MAG: 3-hydroxyacyl-CoA dehydrogenase family protein, partial [Sulfurimonas sp.]